VTLSQRQNNSQRVRGFRPRRAARCDSKAVGDPPRAGVQTSFRRSSRENPI